MRISNKSKRIEELRYLRKNLSEEERLKKRKDKYWNYKRKLKKHFTLLKKCFKQCNAKCKLFDSERSNKDLFYLGLAIIEKLENEVISNIKD